MTATIILCHHMLHSLSSWGVSVLWDNQTRAANYTTVRFFFFFFFFFLQKWKRRLHSVQPQPTHPKITLACTACLSFNLMADQHSLLEIIRDLLTKKVMYQFECYCSTIWDNFNIGHKNNVLIIKSNFKFIYSLFCLYVFLIVFWWAKYRIIL